MCAVEGNRLPLSLAFLTMNDPPPNDQHTISSDKSSTIRNVLSKNNGMSNLKDPPDSWNGGGCTVPLSALQVAMASVNRGVGWMQGSARSELPPTVPVVSTTAATVQ